MVARKRYPTVDQTSFRRIFQTVRDLRKRTTGMSSEGPKMGGGRYGSAWNGRKTKKTGDPPWRPPPRSPARFGCVQRRLAVKFCRQGRLAVLLLPGRCVCARVMAGIVSHGQNPIGLKTGRNDPVRGSRILGSFSRVLELKMSVLGLRFYLAGKTMFI